MLAVAEHTRTKRLSSPQMALILALEPIFERTNLRLVCPHCAANDDHQLLTDNDPMDAEWKFDCACTTRRFHRAHLTHTMTPSGDLIPLAETLLTAVDLVIRCPNRPGGCLTTPLTITHEPDGLTVRCECWQVAVGAGVHRFRKQGKAPVQA